MQTDTPITDQSYRTVTNHSLSGSMEHAATGDAAPQKSKGRSRRKSDKRVVHFNGVCVCVHVTDLTVCLYGLISMVIV